MSKTYRLTATEIAFKRELLRSGRYGAHQPLPKATLEAAIRTGRRIGVEVCAGAYHVVQLGYALGCDGEPTGLSASVPLSEPLPCQDPAAVVSFLEKLS